MCRLKYDRMYYKLGGLVLKILTICIPCHNSINTMHKAIASCLLMKENIQIIVVDNNSSDETYEVLMKYQKEYPNDVLVKHVDNEYFDIIDIIDDIKGLYFKLLKPTDFFNQGSLVSVIDEIKDFIRIQASLDMVITDYKECVLEKKEVKYSFGKTFPEDRIFGWHSIGKLPNGSILNYESVIIKTSIVKTVYKDHPELSKYAFESISYLSLKHVNNIFYLDTYLYCYGEDYQRKDTEYYYEVTNLLLNSFDVVNIKSRKQKRFIISYLGSYVVFLLDILYRSQDNRAYEIVKQIKTAENFKKVLNTDIFKHFKILDIIPEKMIYKYYRIVASKHRL